MKGLGRMLGALNPLDAHAVATAGKAGIRPISEVWARAKTGMKAIWSNPGAYFGGGFYNQQSGKWVEGITGNTEKVMRRGALAAGVGWAGSNLLAPESGMTNLFNTTGLAAGYSGAAGLAMGRNRLAGYAIGGAGTLHIAHRLGII